MTLERKKFGEEPSFERIYEFKLLTADLRRSEHPPKQDVDFWSSLGRGCATGFKLDLAPFVAVSLAVHSTSYYYSCY